jgi:hypothetical protein
MDKVRLVLVLLTIGLAVGPLAGVAVVYRNNLLGLVVPPEIGNGHFSNLVAGNSPYGNLPGLFAGNAPNGTIGQGPNSVNGSLGGGSSGPLQFVSMQADNASRSYSMTFNFTNPLNFDMTLSSMSANVEDAQDGYPLGPVSLSSPVHLAAGETSLITVNGTWTKEAADHLATVHAGARTFDVNLVGMQVDMNGVNLQLNNQITIPNVPIP